jgi:hypothetical protein
MLMFKDFISMSSEQVDEARFAKINRVRAGQVQRRKIVSTTVGYKILGGKLVRMTAQEKMHRKIAQRRGAIKRRSKLPGALRKRRISNRKRTSAGLNR